MPSRDVAHPCAPALRRALRPQQAHSCVPRASRRHPPHSLPPPPSQHKLQNEWALWELRKKDRESGIGIKDWNELPLQLYTFNTVEDFWLCWKRTPQITCVAGWGAVGREWGGRPLGAPWRAARV